jgi:hypothetical protein
MYHVRTVPHCCHTMVHRSRRLMLNVATVCETHCNRLIPNSRASAGKVFHGEMKHLTASMAQNRVVSVL